MGTDKIRTHLFLSVEKRKPLLDFFDKLRRYLISDSVFTVIKLSFTYEVFHNEDINPACTGAVFAETLTPLFNLAALLHNFGVIRVSVNFPAGPF